MSKIVFLDSAPLGLITHPQRSTEVLAVTEWLARCILSGCRVIVPAIAYYELTRELLRANKTSSIGRLDAVRKCDAGPLRPSFGCSTPARRRVVGPGAPAGTPNR